MILQNLYGTIFNSLIKNAEKDLKQHFNSGDQATIKRLNQIVEELKTHPKIGVGKPEPLKYSLSGIWSRRINAKDRLIYKVEKDTVIVLVISAVGHYSDR